MNDTSSREKLGRWIGANQIVILTIAALFTLASIHFAQDIVMNTDTSTYVEKDTLVYKVYEHLWDDRFVTDSIVVLVEGDGATSPESLEAMERLSRQMESVDNVQGTVSIAEMVMDVEAQETGVRKVPDSQARVDEILDELERTDPTIYSILPDRKHTVISVQIPSYINDDGVQVIISLVAHAMEMAEFPAGVDTVVTGEVALMNDIEWNISNSFSNLIRIAALLMVVALLLVFKHVHLPLLPLPIVLLGIIWTMGMQGFLRIDMTVVSMASYMVLIGIGIDYAIQFQNRIDEVLKQGGSIVTAVIDTVANTAPAVLIALIITAAGFGSLLSSTVPMIQDFGLLCLIGIVMCYTASLFVGISIISMVERGRDDGSDRSGPEPKEKKDPIGTVIESIVTFSLRRKKVVLMVAVVLCGIGLNLDTKVEIETDMFEWIPQDLPSLVQYRHLQKIFGGEDELNVIVQGDVADPETLRWMDEFCDYVLESRHTVITATSIATVVRGYNNGTIPQDKSEVLAVLESVPEDTKHQYINGEDTAQIILFLGTGFDNIGQVGISRLQKEIDKDLMWVDKPPGISVSQTGDLVVMNTVVDALTTGRIEMTFFGIIMVFFILLLVYRDLGKALLPVLTMVLVVGWMGGVMYVTGSKYTPMTATLGALILGVGAEYAILNMERFYEEMGKTEDAMEALFKTTRSIGSAIVASGLTTVFGFSALMASPFPLLSNFGGITVVSVILCQFSTFIVFPILLIGLNNWKRRKANAKAAA